MAVPTVEQTPWTAQGEAKREAIKGLFADIAPTYDLLNSVMSLRLHWRWRAKAVALLQLEPGDSALDVCSGTGDFFAPIRRVVGSQGLVAGVDFCVPMLEVSRQKQPDEPVLVGDACRLPFADGSFDAVTVGWGIRNVTDIDAAHAEALRVLKPDGLFVSIDMAQPHSRAMRSVSRFLLERVTPALGSAFGKTQAYRHLPESTKRFLSREELAQSMQRAGFSSIQTHDAFFGNICTHFGRKP